jgi:hypothetical protein
VVGEKIMTLLLWIDDDDMCVHFLSLQLQCVLVTHSFSLLHYLTVFYVHLPEVLSNLKI